jgi:hypothetical protein
MHNRKVFVFQAVNYAASKTSATQNTALNPADLANGSVAIYGIHETGSTNLQKLVLITDGGSEAAGSVPAASFVGKEVFIAMGTATSHQLSNPIQLKAGLKKAEAKIYTAPVRGVLRIGYNGTAGTSLVYPSTVLRGDNFQIDLSNRNDFVTAGREPQVKKNLSVGLAANDGQYVALSKWIAKVNLRTDDFFIDKTLIKVLHNGTGAVFTNTATVAAVNGATSLTTSAAHGVTAGDAISLGGDYYLTITGTTGSTLVLDRPYQGATATIASANTLDITGAATQFGLELVDNKDFLNVEPSVQGIIQDATLKRQTLPSPGNGSLAQILADEKEALPKKGTEDLITSYIPHDVTRSVTTYDQYILTIQNDNMPNGGQGSVFKVINYLTLAFVSGTADTTNFNQSDFEDAMTSLFTTFPAIS